MIWYYMKLQLRGYKLKLSSYTVTNTQRAIASPTQKLNSSLVLINQVEASLKIALKDPSNAGKAPKDLASEIIKADESITEDRLRSAAAYIKGNDDNLQSVGVSDSSEFDQGQTLNIHRLSVVQAILKLARKVKAGESLR